MKMLKAQKKSKPSNIQATFKALIDAVIPETKDLAFEQGPIQLSGALKQYIDEYQIWSLNHILSQTILNISFNIHLAKPTAKILNKAARKLIDHAGNKEPINSVILDKAGAFSAISPNDRLLAISLLEQHKVNPINLNLPFWNNQGLVLSIISTVIMLNTIGYYSGWPGYGSTYLETPEKRTVEHFPVPWIQIGYPGPSKGYHGFRGYLIDKFNE